VFGGDEVSEAHTVILYRDVECGRLGPKNVFFFLSKKDNTLSHAVVDKHPRLPRLGIFATAALSALETAYRHLRSRMTRLKWPSTRRLKYERPSKKKDSRDLAIASMLGFGLQPEVVNSFSQRFPQIQTEIPQSATPAAVFRMLLVHPSCTRVLTLKLHVLPVHDITRVEWFAKCIIALDGSVCVHLA
jgi:hypothetical protein